MAGSLDVSLGQRVLTVWRGEQDFSDFESARWSLVRRLEQAVNGLAERVTVVYDGTIGGRHEALDDAIEVLFTPAHDTADRHIENLVAGSRNPGGILIVTNDRAERTGVIALGAMTQSCEAFLEDLTHDRKKRTRSLQQANMTIKKNSSGDYFP